MNRNKRSKLKGVLPVKVAAHGAFGHLEKMLALAPTAPSMFWHLGLLREAGTPLHLDTDLDQYVHFCETGNVGQVCDEPGCACSSGH